MLHNQNYIKQHAWKQTEWVSDSKGKQFRWRQSSFVFLLLVQRTYLEVAEEEDTVCD